MSKRQRTVNRRAVTCQTIFFSHHRVSPDLFCSRSDCLVKMARKILILPLLAALCALGTVVRAESAIDEFDETGRYTIEGKVYPPELFGGSDLSWQIDTQISINGGEYKGFLRDDGSFVISSVPSGSYVVEIINPDYYYESVRVEINPKGKFRARKLNYVQPSQVVQVPYPLKLKALTRFRYFQQREQWKITDFLFNPMVLMMILPLFVMLILPKMMSDPETKKEMENLNLSKVNSVLFFSSKLDHFRMFAPLQMTNDMPEISEMITSFFTGGAPQAGGSKDKDKAKSASGKQSKKKN